MAPKRRPKRFSVVAAVKANARTQVGQPKPARVFAEKKRDGESKHKPTLARTLSSTED